MIDRAEPLAHQPLSEAELQRLCTFLAGIKNAGVRSGKAKTIPASEALRQVRDWLKR